jgi:hypothetical protein
MDVGSIIGGGFRLIRERPAAVAMWGLLYMLAAVGMSLVMMPIVRAQQGQLQAFRVGAQPPVAAFGAMMGWMFLVVFVFFILYVILIAAAQRAVLKPERQGFFYLRLGMDEVRLFALSLLFIVLFYVGMLALVLVMSTLTGLLAAATGSFGLSVGLGVVGFLIILGLAIWLWTRFALAFPLTLLRGKIIIGEAWRISRGRFWTLFTAFLVIFLMLMVLWAAASLITNGSYFAQLAKSGGDPLAVQRAAQAQMARQLGGVTFTMVLGWIAAAIVGGLSIALWGGAAATAARDLTFNPDEIAETFA